MSKVTVTVYYLGSR